MLLRFRKMMMMVKHLIHVYCVKELQYAVASMVI